MTMEKKTLPISDWMEKAQWRVNNDYWISKAQKIALKTLSFIKKNDLTYSDFAKRIGVSERTLRSILSGKKNINIKTICLLERETKQEFLKIKFKPLSHYLKKANIT